MDNLILMIRETLYMFMFLGLELSVLFLIISAGVSLLQQYIPDSKIQALLSGSNKRSYILAAALGAITPFCSCSTIPMLRGLLKAKAGFGPTLTFLFSSPLLNPIIMGLFVITFGLKVTIVYVIFALFVAIVASYIIDKMGFEKYVILEANQSTNTTCCSLKQEPTTSCCSQSEEQITTKQGLIELKPTLACACTEPESAQKTSACACSSNQSAAVSCCSTAEKLDATNFKVKLTIAFKEAWIQFKQVLPYLLLGVSLGALIYGFVPSEFIANYASGNNLFAVPIAAIIGIPLYVRAEVLIPLSAVLVTKGMSLGAVMALIIGGSGASITELILLKSMFRMQMIIAFLCVILGLAIFAGYFFQFIF